MKKESPIEGMIQRAHDGLSSAERDSAERNLAEAGLIGAELIESVELELLEPLFIALNLIE